MSSLFSPAKLHLDLSAVPLPPRGLVAPPTLPLSKLGGWGFEALRSVSTPHGPSIVVRPLEASLAHHDHIIALVRSAKTRSCFDILGIRWNEVEKTLELPVGETLKGLWDARRRTAHDSGFGIQVVPPSRQSREEWRRAIGLGLFPVSQHGEYQIHDLTDHIPAIATLNRDFARSFQSRMKFLSALHEGLTTECPAAVRVSVRKLLHLHEQQIEHGTVQITINLGHVPTDAVRAAVNIAKVYRRMQNWTTFVGLPPNSTVGDLTLLRDGLIEQLQQTEGWTRGVRESFDQALGTANDGDVLARHLSPEFLALEQIQRVQRR